MLRETVFGPHGTAQHSPLDRHLVARRSITGTVADVSPHIINLRTAAGDKRLILSPRTVAWRGSVVPPARLRAGDTVIVRHFPGRNVAEHIWAQIGRVTGTIIEVDGGELLVDEGPTRRGRQIVRIDAGSFRLFPIQLRRPVAIVVCAGELGLGAGLLVTASGFGAARSALAVRSLTVILFGTAVGALHVLRTRRPAAGCGCFGDLSHTPVNWRTLTRTALLCGAAVAALSAPALHKPASAQQALVVLGLLVVEVSVLVALSPEFAEVMARLGYNEPCEVRRLPVARSLGALRASPQWRQYHRYLITREPADIWREGCWRFAVFPGMLTGRRVEVVFAVYLKPRRPQVRVGVFDPSDASRTLPAVPRQRQDELLPDPAPEDSVVL